MSKIIYPDIPVPPTGHTVEVAPGVHWARMPLPFALDHINLWLLEDGEGLAIVDTGYSLPEVRSAWERILEDFGRPVTRILVTHCHPDHLGLADWLSRKTGAPVAITLGEYLGGHALWHQLPGYNVPDMVAFFRAHGLDQPRLDAHASRGPVYPRGVPNLPATFDRLIHDDIIPIGEHNWRVMAGYGHSPEHAAFYSNDANILISGDMLLPRISTNVSVYAATPHDDPLGRFLESISLFKHLPESTLVLPSHGKPFRGTAARVEQLDEHHTARCEELLTSCQVPKSAGELLATLFPRELDTHQVMFAMGEAIAHLNYLARRGAVRRTQDSDGIVRYCRND